MSTLFWKIFKLSPALLGVSLLFAGSAYAQEGAPAQTVAINTNKPAAPADSAVSASKQPQSLATQPAVSQQASSDIQANANGANQLLAQQAPTSDNATSNPSEVLDQIQQYQPENNSTSAENNSTSVDTLDQVTNVSQLSDVRPTDWAYEALRSLVERYGCIAGYPDGTFRGNRALSRYEFAAGVNACLQQIERLIASSTSEFVTKKDLETLQRLVDEFRTELTALGTRVDKLEGRVAFLEDHQFSTTTKLRGEVIFNFADMFGDQAGISPDRKPVALNPKTDYRNTEAVFQDRVRLNFDTSFTGKDLLRTRLQAGNITEFGALRSNAAGNPFGTNITREGRFGYQVDNGNSISIDRLYYRFPVANIAQVFVGANALQFEDFVELLNPGFDPSGTGSLSRFGRYNPIYKFGGQSQGVGVSIGGGKLPLRVDLGYLTDVGNNPNEKFGLFDGNYTALGQVTFQPIKQFRIAGTYVHTYDRSNLRHGEGSIASQFQTGRPVSGNSYGVEGSFAFTPQLVLSGWGMLTEARAIGLGDGEIWSYGGTLAINDLGKKGSTLGFVVGMEPKLTSTSNVNLANQIVGLQAGRRSDRDTSLHIEGFYKFKLTNNILITPGVIWLTAPGHDSRNDDIFIGTVRTTFTF